MTTRDLLRTLKRLRIERDITFRDLSAQTGLAVSRLFILLDTPETAKLHERTKHKLEQWVEKTEAGK